MIIKLSLKELLTFLIDFFSTTLMINSPNILVGYGLIVPAMILSIMLLRPLKRTQIFLLAHILGSIYLVYTESMFIIASISSLILGPLELFIITYYCEKKYSRE